MPQQLHALISNAIGLLNSGNTQQAVPALREVIKVFPDDHQAYELLAKTLLLTDNADDAIGLAQRAKILSNTNSTCRTLGAVHKACGNVTAAIDAFRDASMHSPDDEAPPLEMGGLFFSLRLLDEALSAYLGAARINKNNANAWYGAGFVARHLGEHENALKYLNRCVQLQPEHAHAWIVRGEVLREQGKYAFAHESNEKAQHLLRYPNGIRNITEKEVRFGHTSAHKLRHDFEQFNYLAARGIHPNKMHERAIAYRSVLDSLPEDKLIHQLSSRQRLQLGEDYNTPIHIYKTEEWPVSPINQELDCQAIEDAYLTSEGNVVCIDHLLREDFLNELHRYCLESTIWYEFKKAGGYIGAYHADGFNATIVQQLAESLRSAFPRVLGTLPLINMWAYKYDSHMSGITTHADSAAVNINFWITPNEGCLDPDSGGLDLYTKEAPLDWDFSRYNNEPKLIDNFIADSPVFSVPHRQNRALMFNSNLFHKTQNINFRDEYPYRRINVTMLYGNRGEMPSGKTRI